MFTSYLLQFQWSPVVSNTYHSRLGQLRPHVHVESAEETIHPAPIEISETSGARIRPNQGNYRKTLFGSALRTNFSLAVASVTP